MCGQVCSVSWLFYLNSYLHTYREGSVVLVFLLASWLYLPGASKACHVNYKVKAKKWWYGSMFLLFVLSTLIIQWKKIDYHQGNLHDTHLVSSRKYCHTFPSLVPLLTRAAWLLEPLTMDTKRFRDAHLLLMLAVCCCPQDVSESSQWPNTNPFLSTTDIFFLVILAGRSLKKQFECDFCLFLYYVITSIDSAGQQELFVSL